MLRIVENQFHESKVETGITAGTLPAQPYTSIVFFLQCLGGGRGVGVSNNGESAGKEEAK